MAKLNLGCGPEWQKQYPDYQGVDVVDFGQTRVGDALSFLSKLDDTSVAEIMANHFLEHCDQSYLQQLFFHAHRVLYQNGLFKFVVPHMDKPKAWVLSHHTFWNEETVNWLGRDDAESTYHFGSWIIEKCVTNSRKDIHAWLRARK